MNAPTTTKKFFSTESEAKRMNRKLHSQEFQAAEGLQSKTASTRCGPNRAARFHLMVYLCPKNRKKPLTTSPFAFLTFPSR